MSALFYRLPNLATDRVEPIENPGDFKVPEEVLKLPKAEYKKRWLNPETNHCLLLMSRGQNESYSVSAGNQASALLGFMADYDGVLTDDMIDILRKKPQSRFLPRFWSRSQSGKLHLFWVFEREITVTGNAHANKLLKLVAKKLKAAKWGVGYDPDSELVTQVMDIGSDWHVFEAEASIPAAELVAWDATIFEESVRGVVEDAVDIPFDVVSAEVKKRKWPHEVPVNFSVGARCVRFWDPSADNATGAQIVKDGIRVYTPHDNGFKSWKSLLGAEFCEAYTSKSMSPFLEDTTYCHTKDEYWRFFRNDAPPHYEKRTEKVLRRDLKKEARLADKPGKGELLSELDQMLYTISRKNTVDSVAPVLYRPTGRIFVPGIGTVLNTSLVTVLKPAPRLVSLTAEDLGRYPNCPQKYRENPMDCKWDNPFAVEKFPHIHRLLTGQFMHNQVAYDRWIREGASLHDENGNPQPFLSDGQLQTLLSWVSHFYFNAAKQSQQPGRGQALILAGDRGVGKSFFATEILGRLAGGWDYADKMYLEGARFNDTMVKSPIHVIDDKLGSKSQRDRLKFTETLKVTVANARVRCEAKFGSAIEALPWPGRIVILSNTDAQSMSVLPDLDMSTRDKFIMLKLGGVRFAWGTDAENQRWLGEELPYFARFVLGWEIPFQLRDERFGVKACQHADMAQASAENGITQQVVDILETCIERATGSRDDAERSDADGWIVEGNQAKILQWIRSTIDPSLSREIENSRELGIGLSILLKNGSYNLGYDEDRKRWKIPYVLRKKIKDIPS